MTGGPMGAVTRRGLLVGAAGLGTATLLSGCGTSTEGGRPLPVPVDPALAANRMDAPSFIVILSDDHRADHLGLTGVAPGLQTPNLDRIAETGVRFTDSTVVTALCSPSRASFVTGQYSRRNGVVNNISAWNPANTTVFEHLAAAGYRCGYIGKWHMPGALPDLRGVETFITFTIEEGQGVYTNCPLVVNGVDVERPGTYITTDLTDLALEWLRAGDPEQPYCLFLAHKAVHHPFEPPADLAGTLDAADLRPTPDEGFTWQTLLERNVWEGTAGRLEEVYRNYCETLLGLDREIGRVLDYVDASPRGRDTVVVYTSDNGYSWGEQTLTGKRWAYDVTAEVPLLVRWPQGIEDPGAVRKAPVLNIDLAPTLLDLAGLPAPADMQGVSWAPLLNDDDPDWRPEVYYEYFLDYPYQVPAHQAVRTADWVYIEYERGLGPELYDRTADPAQRTNLYGTPGTDQIVGELSAALADLRAAAA